MQQPPHHKPCSWYCFPRSHTLGQHVNTKHASSCRLTHLQMELYSEQWGCHWTLHHHPLCQVTNLSSAPNTSSCTSCIMAGQWYYSLVILSKTNYSYRGSDSWMRWWFTYTCLPVLSLNPLSVSWWDTATTPKSPRPRILLTASPCLILPTFILAAISDKSSGFYISGHQKWPAFSASDRKRPTENDGNFIGF